MTSAELARVQLLTPVQAAALTSFLEARDQPVMGIVAVLSVIRNRARIRHKEWTDICFAPYQFSCWNATDPQSHLGLVLAEGWLSGLPFPDHADIIVLEVCTYLAGRIADGQVPDPTHGATHYHTTTMVPPTWARPPAVATTTIGRHRFYRGVRPFVEPHHA